MKKNLILTGMMGVGKTTLGKALSILLKMKFIDTDAEIEKIESDTINNIFKNKGEDYFRTIEREICLKFAKRPNSIIALGGGAIVNKEIRDFILKECITFWLDIDLKILRKRLINSKKRPLLNDDDMTKKITDIYEKRKIIYNLAKFKITCDNKDRIELTKEIKQIYEKN